jgi:hypothetical protein
MKPLNGWQRIGVVLSVLYWLFIGGLISHEYFEHFQAKSEFLEWNQCMESWLEEEADTHIPSKDTATPCDHLPSRLPSYHKPDLLIVTGFLILPIGIWLIIYLLIWTIQWIKAGFKEVLK